MLHGRHLSLYLDRAPDNSPVDGAEITLEVNGAAVPVQAHGTGEYEATLPQPLAELTRFGFTAAGFTGGQAA